MPSPAAPLAEALERPRQRQRPGRVLPARRAAADPRGGAAGRRLPGRRTRRESRCQRPRRPRPRHRRGAPAHPARPHARRRHDRGSGRDLDRRRRRASRRTRPSCPGTSLRGSTAIGAGTTDRADDHADRLANRRARHRDPLLPDRLPGRRRGARSGPFTYLRPDASIGEGAKAGSFVEIKNSEIGAGAKVPHLSYIGDAEVGEGTNLGASTDHRELRRAQQKSHQDRQERPDGG